MTAETAAPAIACPLHQESLAAPAVGSDVEHHPATPPTTQQSAVVEDEESADDFPETEQSVAVLMDPETLAMISQRSRPGPSSVATTALASAVGSVMGPPRDAFLKSMTFLKGQQEQNGGWGIRFAANTTATSSRGAFMSGKKRKHVVIESVSESFALSPIKEGDYLKSINRKRCVGPSWNANRALQLLNQSMENEGVLSVAVENPNGSDVLVQATILKPKTDMTCEDLGIVVWNWGFLCIKSIDKKSIFKYSVLKECDQIISVNDILCEGMKPTQFAEIIETLELEITITVLRRKQRANGMFG